jgi:hypothetical protein
MSDYGLHATHQEPRPSPRQRVPNRVHVDLMHSAAAEQLVLTAHVDMSVDGRKRRIPGPGFEAYLSRRLQAIVDVELPFLEAPVAAAVEAPGASEQAFDVSEAPKSAPEAAEPGSAAQDEQS